MSLPPRLLSSLPRARAGYKGTWVCEPDKHKALEMYKAYKAGVKYEPAAAHH